MWPDRVANPGPLTYELGVLPTATILIIVGQGPTVLSVGAGCLDIFNLIYLYSPLSPSL